MFLLFFVQDIAHVDGGYSLRLSNVLTTFSLAGFQVTTIGRFWVTAEAVKQLEAGRPVKEVAREMGVTDQTLYNWKAKFGGMEVSDAKKLRALEEENRRLKEMVADLSLDKAALTTVIRKNGWSL